MSEVSRYRYEAWFSRYLAGKPQYGRLHWFRGQHPAALCGTKPSPALRQNDPKTGYVSVESPDKTKLRKCVRCQRIAAKEMRDESR